MRKYILLSVAVVFATTGFAQKKAKPTVNTLIKNADVERIIKTLSADDMQGRGTFTPGIEKAAQFIESEYKNIGLKPLKGAANYRQNFSMVKNSVTKITVSINGVNISP